MNAPLSKTLITGASGFIGSRIAERLWLDYAIAARCLVRNHANAARLARLPVVMCPGDVLDISSLENAMADSRVVFHCAYGNSDDPDFNRRINEEGLRNLGETALRRGVERFIHLSTVSVYGPEPPDRVTEETPVCFSADEYGNSKIRAEAICHELAAWGLPVVIIRPTIVFGPHSPIWTIGAAKRVQSGGWENTGDIRGLCNPVYIDDLVDGLFLCVDRDAAIGQTFILSGDSPVTWNVYFQAYKSAVGLPEETGTASTGNPAWRKAASRLLGANLRMLRKFMEPQLIELYERMKTMNPHLARTLYALVYGGVRDNEKAKFNSRTVYAIEKAATLLGYAPRPFAEGMKETIEWLTYYEYI